MTSSELHVAAANAEPFNWANAAAIIAAIGGFLTGLLAWWRNRRTDKLTLYSQFVDDLHTEVERLRTQADQDRERWSTERALFMTQVDNLSAEVRRLKREIATLKARASKSAAARKAVLEDVNEELETELLRVRREVELLKARGASP